MSFPQSFKAGIHIHTLSWIPGGVFPHWRRVRNDIETKLKGLSMDKSLVSITQKGEVVVLRLHEKRFYQHAVPELEEKVRMLIEQSQVKFCVDLSDVEVMNSSAIGILILLADYVKRADGRMAVTGFNPLLEELFKRMRLDTLFPLVRDQEEGLALLNE